MDYATYIRVRAEMAEHRQIMEQGGFPNEANGWRDRPTLLQRIVADVTDFLGSKARREPTIAGEKAVKQSRPSVRRSA